MAINLKAPELKELRHMYRDLEMYTEWHVKIGETTSPHFVKLRVRRDAADQRG